MPTLTIKDHDFLQDGHLTYTRATGFPDADPRMAGLLLNHRVVNGIFDDLNADQDYDGDGVSDWQHADGEAYDPDRNTHAFLDAMPMWRERGVIAFTIGLQGGNPFHTCPIPEGVSTEDIDCGAFNRDGSLRQPFMTRLSWILDKARALDMVPIVNFFYFGGNRRVDEDAIPTAIENATNWLLEHDYDNLIIDLANECNNPKYWPALHLDGIASSIYLVKDVIDVYAQRTRKARHIYVSASLGPRHSVADKIADLPQRYMQAIDVFMPHGNQLTTEQVAAGIDAARERMATARGAIPIVNNEDVMANPTDPDVDNGGDLAHLEACIAAHASWGNLIRSQQEVPCVGWVEATDVQRAWFARTSELAGPALPPSSTLHRTYDIMAPKLERARKSKREDQ